MPEKITAENLFNGIVETIAENVPKQKSVSFVEGDMADAVTSQFKRLFGRQKLIHRLFGSGKSADLLLWRNKKISAGVLAGATAIWVLLEWLDYHFLTLVCFALIFGMLTLFLWSNVFGLLSRTAFKPPHLVVPNDVFVDIGKSVGAEVNQALKFLQDVALGGNLKQFLVVVGSLWAAAIIGGLCNFITVLYIGFVAAHTLPVLYERYEDQVDSFGDQVLDQLQHHYRKLAPLELKSAFKGNHEKQGGAPRKLTVNAPDVYAPPTQLLDIITGETKQKKLPKKEKIGGKEGQKGKETIRGGARGRDSSRGGGGSKNKKKKQNHRTGKSDQVDSFGDQVLDQLQHHSHKLAPLELKSAVKGNREKQGGAPRKLTVTWAPDVIFKEKQEKLPKKEEIDEMEGQKGKETTRGGGRDSSRRGGGSKD
ncbi:reticulon-like protein B8 isoform X2 [Eucalyptus grandis]|uniref:reticulon-like protein B8 isoform X2 n=1 Tax=Eucalyptus grandis TaxID=71139 RepID=UPI00192E7B99|nr:reticulon-like protein B8 isoform X2 [Eucalyptus grandis]